MHIRYLLISLIFSTTIQSAAQGDIGVERKLGQLFQQGPQVEDFSAAALAAVPWGRIEATIAGLNKALGPLEGIQLEPDGTYRLQFNRGEARTIFALGLGEHIEAFVVTEAKFASPAIARQAWSELPGAKSFLITKTGSQSLDLEPDLSLAVGSSFKLAVLNALRDAVARGEIKLDQVVPLPTLVSLPSGILQDWPPGSPLTVHTLAALMISISDNTATDILIDLIGREKVEQYAGQNRPLLKTREMFWLRTGNASIQERWRRSDEAKKRQILAEIDQLPLTLADANNLGYDPNIEWRFSTRELCNLITPVANLPLMAINPGYVDPASSDSIAFKGGNDIGIVNFTTHLSKEGKSGCVSATINSPELNLDEAVIYYMALLGTWAELQ